MFDLDEFQTTVKRTCVWLEDANGPNSDVRRLSQVLKVNEEAGECAEAIINALGLNPAKPIGAFAEVGKELADTVATAVIAMYHLDIDPAVVMHGWCVKTNARIDAS